MLKQQLQKIEQELAARFIQRLADNLRIPDTRIVEHGSLYRDLQVFIRQAQIEAVKAFAEELQPFLYEYPGIDEKESGHNEAVQEIKQAINNLLKDI